MWNFPTLPLVRSTGEPLAKLRGHENTLCALAMSRQSQISKHQGTAIVAEDVHQTSRAHDRNKLQLSGFPSGLSLKLPTRPCSRYPFVLRARASQRDVERVIVHGSRAGAVLLQILMLSRVLSVSATTSNVHCPTAAARRTTTSAMCSFRASSSPLAEYTINPSHSSPSSRASKARNSRNKNMFSRQRRRRLSALYRPVSGPFWAFGRLGKRTPARCGSQAQRTRTERARPSMGLPRRCL